MQSKIITAENLVAGYPGNIVWRDASFDIDRGEFVAIIGPNGAGKTTLFRLLLGLLQPIGGTIKIFDSQPKRGNPLIGYVPQRHLIDSEMNVESLELAHRGLNTLSGGELQRIFLAEALVSNPELLLLDEALSNLDMKREKDL